MLPVRSVANGQIVVNADDSVLLAADVADRKPGALISKLRLESPEQELVWSQTNLPSVGGDGPGVWGLASANGAIDVLSASAVDEDEQTQTLRLTQYGGDGSLVWSHALDLAAALDAGSRLAVDLAGNMTVRTGEQHSGPGFGNGILLSFDSTGAPRFRYDFAGQGINAGLAVEPHSGSIYMTRIDTLAGPSPLVYQIAADGSSCRTLTAATSLTLGQVAATSDSLYFSTGLSVGRLALPAP